MIRKYMLAGALAAVAMLALGGQTAAQGITLNQEAAMHWHVCVDAQDALDAASASVQDVMAGTEVWVEKVAKGLCARLPQPVPMTVREVIFEEDFEIGPSGKLRVMRAELTKPDGSVHDVWVIASDVIVEPTLL